MESQQIDLSAISKMITNKGNTLGELSDRQPVMLVFLRHFGCTFCREALSDIAKERQTIEQEGSNLVFVHMTDNEIADRYFQRYGLEGVEHISDPACNYYAAFGLTKGTFNQLFGLQSWIRGFSAGVMEGHGVGLQLGDGFQMPGIFIIHEGVLKDSFIHKLASDRPNYRDLVRCCNLAS